MAALAWLAPGSLTHFLALVYAGVFGLHLLSTSWRNLPTGASSSGSRVGCLDGPWFGYIMLNFGVRRTLRVNTTDGRDRCAGTPDPLARVLIANLCPTCCPGRLPAAASFFFARAAAVAAGRRRRVPA
jgi:hypothetical protein